jgi:hypothetical protein
VFSNGDGKYDNAGGKDYHSPVGDEDGEVRRGTLCRRVQGLRFRV